MIDWFPAHAKHICITPGHLDFVIVMQRRVVLDYPPQLNPTYLGRTMAAAARGSYATSKAGRPRHANRR